MSKPWTTRKQAFRETGRRVRQAGRQAGGIQLLVGGRDTMAALLDQSGEASHTCLPVLYRCCCVGGGSDFDLSSEDEWYITHSIADGLSKIGCHEEAVKTARRGLELCSPKSPRLVAEQVGAVKHETGIRKYSNLREG